MLTDEQIIEVLKNMPGGKAGFRDRWGYVTFGRAIEAATLATVTPLVQQLVDALEWSTADDFEVPYKCEEAITAARAFLSGATKESTDHG